MSRREPYVFEKPEDGAKVFWKSLEDKARPDLAQKRAETEFPLGLDEAKLAASSAANLVKLRRAKDQPSADAGDVSVGRRGFMFAAGAAAALFAEGCARRPVEKILPYSKAPEQVLPGVPRWYATVRAHRGEAIGVLVESHEGRPTKVEGNPEHPASLGATDLHAQASSYDLYDPDRSTTPMKGQRLPGGGYSTHVPATWAELDAALAEVVRTSQADGGARLRILAQATPSPTFIRLRDAIASRLPKAQVYFWSPVADANTRAGAKIAFGQDLNVVPSLAHANVVLALDSDFLGTAAGSVRATKEFAEGRSLRRGPASTMNRLYVVEPSFTSTGMSADHRLRLAAQDVEGYLLALAKELGVSQKVELGASVKDIASKASTTAIPEVWLKAVAKDLAANRGKSIILVGDRQPPRVHALAHAVNAALGNAGNTVQYFPVADLRDSDPLGGIKQLAVDLEKNMVSQLIILGGNPAWDAPADLKLGDKIKTVASSFHFASRLDETGELCGWYAPRADDLEAWGDLRSLDGTVAIQQPLIAPLFGGKSDIEVLARFTGETQPKGYALVQQTVKGSVSNAGQFDRQWNEALKKGVLGPAAKAMGPLDARDTEVAAAFAQSKAPAPLSPQSLEVTFAPCPKLFDGRHANNPLLLELPDPVTKITWDNVALFSASTAKALGIESGDLVRFSRANASPIDLAAWIMPGQADNSVALVLGWGRTKTGRYGNKRGFDVYPFRTTDALWIASGVTAKKLDLGEIDAIKDRFRKVGMAAGESPAAGRVRPDGAIDVETNKYKISQTQEHDNMEGRPIAIDTTLAEYKKEPNFPQFPSTGREEKNEQGKLIAVRESGSPDPTVPPLWGNWKDEKYWAKHKWGLSIDLNACTGCNACVVACQVENNVPNVGKEQIWRGREMYWLRIDRYFVGLDVDNPQVVFQPVACVQCEDAPCENVCPVNATAHSPEGLNDMAYNRCIGTRYCANNCPYKVRRFNFLNYQTSGGMYDDVPEVERMKFNPNVTVRMRGVMEKCTYCVQRIQEAKIKSKRTGKPIQDGEIKVACQQACAADCIVFGDLGDKTSRVSRLREDPRAYRLLAEIGTRPRTSYLGKVRNPNPEMEKGA